LRHANYPWIFKLVIIAEIGLGLHWQPAGLEVSQRNTSSRHAAKLLLAKLGWAETDFAGFTGQ